MRLQRFQHFMYPHERENITDAGQKQYIAGFAGAELLNFGDELILADSGMKLSKQEVASVGILHFGDGVQNIDIRADAELSLD